MAAICEIYVITCEQERKNPISYCLCGGRDLLFIHRTNPKCDTVWHSFVVCQKIRRDNLAPVTWHYSRQWNTREAVVTPLWCKHKGCALGQYRPQYGYHCHTAIQPCRAPQVGKGKTQEANFEQSGRWHGSFHKIIVTTHLAAHL